MKKSKVVVTGLGEIGKPLFDLISERHDVVGVDVSPQPHIETADILHICYPFQISDFIGETARYIDLVRPSLTIIESTVALGTTRTIAEQTGAMVVNSPVRGKHAHMLEELRMYVKYVGALTPEAGDLAAAHFESLGLKAKVLPSPEATELAKLTETTYFGVLIAWAQEIERYCDQTGQNYAEVVSFFDEIKYLPPVRFFPGVIGGHCVMPNIELLGRDFDSLLLHSIEASNRMKVARDAHPNAVAVGA